MGICRECSAELKYSDEWDAHYCRFCNTWEEAPCCIELEEPDEGLECPFNCWERPNKPLVKTKFELYNTEKPKL